ncbi:hypothetical protein GPECTOR_692g832 [Gonium pectorale]|uniref:Uncharacterized protein n=1 Tax=Gonium pectorale TaxID=33097 RepID=A0A150FU79_GONPE|nr:hypothetical protein GPECTOR_692g832 [Gonium pectorale]|eukprot:KXZ41171.1 hypothetical protein GPECTOR_692g832 [Gonium pectorale]
MQQQQINCFLHNELKHFAYQLEQLRAENEQLRTANGDLREEVRVMREGVDTNFIAADRCCRQTIERVTALEATVDEPAKETQATLHDALEAANKAVTECGTLGAVVTLLQSGDATVNRPCPATYASVVAGAAVPQHEGGEWRQVVATHRRDKGAKPSSKLGLDKEAPVGRAAGAGANPASGSGTATPGTAAAAEVGDGHVDRSALLVEGVPADWDADTTTSRLCQRVKDLTGHSIRISGVSLESHSRPGAGRTTQRLRIQLNGTVRQLLWKHRKRLPNAEEGDNYFPPLRICWGLTPAGLAFRRANHDLVKYLANSGRRPSWCGTHLMAEESKDSGKWMRQDIDRVRADMEAARQEASQQRDDADD